MSWDPTWETVFQAQEWGKYPPERVIRFVARNFYGVPDRSSVRLLDLGCGTGACTWYMAREGFAVSGIDGSETGIARSRARLAEEHLTAEFRVGDFRQLPWESGSFDGVVDNAAIYSNRWEDCGLIVKEVRRVLKPGGRFLSVSFTPRTWGYGLGDEVEPDGFASIPVGPLSGRGFCLFMDRARIQNLYHGFDTVCIDTEAITIGGSERTIENWVVTCSVSDGRT